MVDQHRSQQNLDILALGLILTTLRKYPYFIFSRLILKFCQVLGRLRFSFPNSIFSIGLVDYLLKVFGILNNHFIGYLHTSCNTYLESFYFRIYHSSTYKTGTYLIGIEITHFYHETFILNVGSLKFVEVHFLVRNAIKCLVWNSQDFQMQLFLLK